jgi:hypothetical protein
MSLHRWFVMVMVLIALPFAATPVFARSAGSRTRSIRTPEDDAQMRELLSKLAAATGKPSPEERTDADLMYEAMLHWNGEPAGSAAVDRLIESSKKEAARSKRATVEKVRAMFWKDPFANDPQKLIPVRQEDRDLLDDYERRTQRRAEVRQGHAGRESEVSRLRAEVEAARADAIAARTENARLRELEATSDRRECVADNDARAEVRRRHRSAGSPSGSHRHPEQMLTQVAMATPATSVQSYQPPAPPPPVSTPIPAHGIIVVPLPSPPPPVVVVEKGRRSPSSRSAR